MFPDADLAHLTAASKTESMKTTDFDYALPPELIAQHPPEHRTGSRLLHLDGKGGDFVDRHFTDLPDLLRAGDLLVFNDTKVIKARLHGLKSTGGSVEVLVERVLPEHGGRAHRALAHVRASKSPKAGARLLFAHGVAAMVEGRRDDLFLLNFEGGKNVFELLAQIGEVPLPPYITHPPADDDESRYQTVYAKNAGSVAAPTAGLHFDHEILALLESRGVRLAFVTLHVGAGTFRPVRDDDVSKHVMHQEWYAVPEQTVAAVTRAKAQHSRVISVGTTSMRTLESAAQGGCLLAGSAETALFITPGYEFRVADCLITNFHLPKSTLMMLVSAFAGHENTMRAYAHAVTQRYRFFSYGDAMFIERGQAGAA
ncbi:MAG: tRNA preQ1(34) S-adenosylmethionine ribosyltransferase-isomerase QueA [Rhodocyclaceae bacterium]|nr:tRNA preQ1(34) S-adenosylmethionine ribosyltransferase-isomerase QueA [Rhodocyclaceae bacterium]